MHSNGRFFSSVAMSGSHETSLRMIAAGCADVAAVDCVLYALLERHRPQELRGTRILCRSGHMPAPPYVAGANLSGMDILKIREALAETLEAPALRSAKETLLLQGVEPLPPDAYHPIAELERVALDIGYSEIPCSPGCVSSQEFEGNRSSPPIFSPQ
jgi:ABC-type phosphate/phosphonate transport system substrate-binding protein